MFIKQKQGCGRLLRIVTDTGAVAVLDIRALLHYKSHTLAAFPNARVTSDIGDIERLMREKKGPEYFA